MRRHPLTAFYIIAFAISWGAFVALVGPGSLVNEDWRAEGAFLAAVMAMLAGPCVAGLLLTGVTAGRQGYRDLLLSLGRWRVGLRWYAMALLPAPLAAAGVLYAVGLPAPLFSDGGSAVAIGGLGAGVTTLLEEIGWTAFAVPRLRRRHSVLITGVIAGVLWGVWHLLQQIFVSGTYAGGMPLGGFVALSVGAAIGSLSAYRVLMVWVYDRTDSLLVTTLMHAMLTASTIFWFSPAATGARFLADVWLVAVVFWVFVGVVALVNPSLSQRPAQREWRPSPSTSA